MEQKIINDISSLEQLILTLSGDVEIKIEIPNENASKIFDVFKNPNIKVTRNGFNRYILSKEKRYNISSEKIIKIRLLCLIITFLSLVVLIIEILNYLWKNEFVTVPIFDFYIGIIGIILTIIFFIFKSFDEIKQFLKNYLGSNEHD